MITGCPRSAERLTWLPSSSGRVKRGAGCPGARRSSVTFAPFGKYGRTHGTGRGHERAGATHVSPGTPECRLACRHDPTFDAFAPSPAGQVTTLPKSRLGGL